MSIFSINTIWYFLFVVCLINFAVVIWFWDRVWWSYATKGDFVLLTRLAPHSRLQHAMLQYFPGSHIYYNFGQHGHGELKCLPHQSSYKNGVWNTDRATWAVTFLLVDRRFTRKALWPCLTNLQLKRQEAHGAHRAPTLQLPQALHQLPCVQHGRDGQKPALLGGGLHLPHPF